MDFENKVIRRVQAGDREAFAYLIKRYQRPLFVLAGSLGVNSRCMEDVVQEIFLAAFEHIQRFEPRRGAFSSWLYRIARNRCLNEFKKKREHLKPDIEQVSGSADVEEDILRRERFRQLDEALGRLPLDQRMVFILADLQGLSYEEISQIENLPAGTVKSRLARARRKIAQTLNSLQE